jgi:hypothetical protein
MTIVKQRSTPKLTITSKGRAFQESLYAKKDWLCSSSAFKEIVLLALSFVLPWKVANVDEVWL